MAIGSQPVPDPQKEGSLERRQALEKALRYMDLPPGKPLLGHPVDVVFIGSCTNARLSDLREAAAVLRCENSAHSGSSAQRRVAENVRLLVVPGSEDVRRQAEAGADQASRRMGEWRRAGCSTCIAMNGDRPQPGEYAVSTSNRNFEGRQGPGGRTFLASPVTAAAAALTGKITDPRTLL
jgi:3-isopropylmalate/(R)-2-methylmalate dehydratase large subunit